MKKIFAAAAMTMCFPVNVFAARSSDWTESFEKAANASAILQIIQSSIALFVILGLAALLIPYIFTGYMWFLTGRKAKVDSDKGWMCFIPIARSIYQCAIIRYPLWYIIFLPGLLNGIVSALIGMIFNLLKIPVLAMICVIIFSIVSLVFRYSYFKEFYRSFGYHPNTAFVEIIPTAAMIGVVFRAAIAFSKRIAFRSNGNAGGGTAPVVYDDDPKTQGAVIPPVTPGRRPVFITGISGMYAGATFDVSDGKPIVFGRSAEVANVVFDQTDTDISREHCTIRYDSLSGQFILTDKSTNGTYDSGNNRYTKNQQTNIPPGTVIYLGKTRKNAFRIG